MLQLNRFETSTERAPRLRRVTIVGTGLIGTSIALALRGHGVEVRLSDFDRDAELQAAAAGAGVPLTERHGPADLVVLAVPPSRLPAVLLAAQQRGLGMFYTDVASVKAAVIDGARELGCDLEVFVPGHPMAGSEHRGPAMARGDLFTGRAWALCPIAATQVAAIKTVVQLASLAGATVHHLAPQAHDVAVALISHVPHLVSSLLAAQLTDADPVALQLSGQGLLDVTRIAAGDVQLWTDILTQNAAPVADLMTTMAADLDRAARSLHAVAAGIDPGELVSLLAEGNAGRARLLTSRSAGPVRVPVEQPAIIF